VELARLEHAPGPVQLQGFIGKKKVFSSQKSNSMPSASMKPLIHLSRLPAQYRKPVRALCRVILQRYPNTAAFAVVGSVADGSWDQASDLDLVWVRRGRLRKRWHEELDYHFEGVVELVPMNLAELRHRFAQHSPMAHAIQRGIVLCDPDRVLKRYQQKPLGQPSRDWMQEWFKFFWPRFDWGLDAYHREQKFHRRFCRQECHCQVSEILTRAVLNLARLLLATAGLVSNSKTEMRRQYPQIIRGRHLRRAMETTLQAHHEKRDLTLAEAAELVYLGRWLGQRLVGLLGKSGHR
jgi:hypothetical protein